MAAKGYALFTTRRMRPDEPFTTADIEGIVAHGYTDETHGGLSRLSDDEQSTLWRSINNVLIAPMLEPIQERGTVLSLSEQFFQENPAWRPSAEAPYASRVVSTTAPQEITPSRATMPQDNNRTGIFSPKSGTRSSSRACDGGLDPKDIFSTGQLSDDQAHAPPEHCEMLEDLGLRVDRDNPPVRLRNEDGSNDARWTSFRAFVQAQPLAMAHPALQDFCFQHQRGSGSNLHNAESDDHGAQQHVEPSGSLKGVKATPSKKLAATIDSLHLDPDEDYDVPQWPPLSKHQSTHGAESTWTPTTNKPHALVAEIASQANTAADASSAEAYQQAAKFVYFNTIGRTVWKHLYSDDRADILSNARQLHFQPLTHTARICLQKALDDIMLVEVSETSPAPSSVRLDPEMVELAASTYARLWTLVSFGKQCHPSYLLGDDAQCFRDLGRCVVEGIAVPVKLEMICLAKTVCPLYSVEVNHGDVLDDLCAELYVQLRGEGIPLAGGERHQQVDHGPAPSRPPVFRKMSRKGQAPLGLRSALNNSATESALPRAGSSSSIDDTDPPLTTNSPAGQSTRVLQGLDEYTVLYTGADPASTAFHQPRRHPMQGNETLNDINTDQFVKEVYDAIRATPKDPTPAQTKMIRDLEKRVESLETPTATLTQVSHLVVDAFIALYQHGDSLRPDQINQIRPTPADNAMTSKQRKKYILRALKATKRLAYHLLDGQDAIVAFVAAPESADDRINKNKVRNDWRAQQKKEAKAAIEALGAQEADAESYGPSPTKKAKISKKTAARSAPVTPSKSKSTTEAGKATGKGPFKLFLRTSPRKRGHSAIEGEEMGDAQEESEEE